MEIDHKIQLRGVNVWFGMVIKGEYLGCYGFNG